MKELGYGKGYKYSHSYPGNFSEQEFLPDELSNASFFKAGSSAKEKEIEEIIHKLWVNKYKE